MISLTMPLKTVGGALNCSQATNKLGLLGKFLLRGRPFLTSLFQGPTEACEGGLGKGRRGPGGGAQVAAKSPGNTIDAVMSMLTNL